MELSGTSAIMGDGSYDGAMEMALEWRYCNVSSRDIVKSCCVRVDVNVAKQARCWPCAYGTYICA